LVLFFLLSSSISKVVEEGFVKSGQKKSTKTINFVIHRDFGFGKRSMEALIEDEFTHLSQKLEKSKGNPIDTMDLFNIPILNALLVILTGERLDSTDPKLTKTMLLIEKLIADSGSSLAFLGFSSSIVLKILEVSGLLTISSGIESIFKIVDEQITDHEATFQEGAMRDFIDCFIDQKILKNESSESRKFAKRNLRNIFLDLFLAGSETTSSTLKWAVLYMALNPEVQAKLQVQFSFLEIQI